MENLNLENKSKNELKNKFENKLENKKDDYYDEEYYEMENLYYAKEMTRKKEKIELNKNSA